MKALTARKPRDEDRETIRELVAGSGVFTPLEIETAVELFDASRIEGQLEDYHSIVLEEGGEIVGWACFGEVPLTEGTFDLYWIAVSPDRRRRGYGRATLRAVEGAVRSRGGRKIVAETSDRPGYESTNAFYRATGFQEQGRLPDFYRPGDTKVIYVRDVPPETGARG